MVAYNDIETYKGDSNQYKKYIVWLEWVEKNERELYVII